MNGSDVTIVLPNYNHGRYLKAALDAISGQTLAADRIIIIDDASTDNSLDISETFVRRHSSARLVRHHDNQGVNHSCNEGLEQVNTRYVLFSAADDRLLPRFLERAVTMLAQHRTAGLCSTDSLSIDDVGRTTGRFPSPLRAKEDLYLDGDQSRKAFSRHGSWIMGNATLYRTDYLCQINGFPESLGPYADGFVSMVLALRHGVCYIPEPLACWRRLGTGYSSSEQRNPAKALALLQEAKHLLTTGYRGLMSSEEISRWEARWRFNAMESLFLNHPDNLPSSLLPLIDGNRTCAKCAFPLLLRLHGHFPRLTTAVLYSLMRPFDIISALVRLCNVTGRNKLKNHDNSTLEKS